MVFLEEKSRASLGLSIAQGPPLSPPSQGGVCLSFLGWSAPLPGSDSTESRGGQAGGCLPDGTPRAEGSRPRDHRPPPRAHLQRLSQLQVEGDHAHALQPGREARPGRRRSPRPRGRRAEPAARPAGPGARLRIHRGDCRGRQRVAGETAGRRCRVTAWRLRPRCRSGARRGAVERRSWAREAFPWSRCLLEAGGAQCSRRALSPPARWTRPG